MSSNMTEHKRKPQNSALKIAIDTEKWNVLCAIKKHLQ